MTQQAEHQERSAPGLVKTLTSSTLSRPKLEDQFGLRLEDRQGHQGSDTPEAQIHTELPTSVVGVRTTLWYRPSSTKSNSAPRVRDLLAANKLLVQAKKTANWKLKFGRVGLSTGGLTIAFTDASWGRQRGCEVTHRLLWCLRLKRAVLQNKEDAPPYLTIV
eukprot:2699882-Amphidinium_carterae.2